MPNTVEGHQVTPLSFSSRLFLAQMVCVCYGLWLQRLHVFIDLAVAHCKDTHLLSPQPADADVWFRRCKVYRYCSIAGLVGDAYILNSQEPSWRHKSTLLPAGPDKTTAASHSSVGREREEAVWRYFNESRRGDLLCIGS